MRKLEQPAPKNPGIVRRRKFRRAEVDLPNSYSVIEEDCIRQGYGRIVDLNVSGARMSSESEFVAGSEVSLHFDLPGAQREVYVTGRIVMSFFDGPTQAHLHGIAFTQISHGDQDAIAGYVDDILLSTEATFAHLVKRLAQSSDVPLREKKQRPNSVSVISDSTGRKVSKMMTGSDR